jgi:NAD(P)H-nitrite reductase large subunit
VDNIICRCEEITEDEIRDAIRKFDLRTVNDVKRLTGASMGLCQGRSCEPLIKRIMAQETNRGLNQVQPLSRRPPTKPIKMEALAQEKGFEI